MKALRIVVVLYLLCISGLGMAQGRKANGVELRLREACGCEICKGNESCPKVRKIALNEFRLIAQENRKECNCEECELMLPCKKVKDKSLREAIEYVKTGKPPRDLPKRIDTPNGNQLHATNKKMYDSSKRVAEGIYKKYNTKFDIVYKEVGGEKLCLDIVLPKEKVGDKGAPVIMFLHGGGWIRGNRFKLTEEDLNYYTSRGIAMGTISYRNPNSAKKFTLGDSYGDAKDAIRYVIKNAKSLGIDPDRVAIYGTSAGGTITQITALSPDDIFSGDKSLRDTKVKLVCAVAHCGPTNFDNPEGRNDKQFIKEKEEINVHLFGENYKPETLMKLSPTTYIREDSDIPLMLLNGEIDPLVPVKSQYYFMKVAKEKGYDKHVTAVYIKNGLHGFNGKDASPSADEQKRMIREFFVKHLKQ